MKKVVFANHWHNGDIHVSRGFVRQIMQKVKQIDPNTRFVYSHKNAPNLLSDITDLEFDPTAINNIKEHETFVSTDDTIYINTWYGQNHRSYLNKYGVTFDTLYVALDDTCKKLWGFSLSNISSDPRDFFPIIDYSKFQIQEARNWLYSHSEKKIFVENAHAFSGQATNFDLTSIIIDLAKKHTNKSFILSNHAGSKVLPSNVYYSREIIKSFHKPSDLNENSFLSSHCASIIGRASGPFTFSLTQENLFNRNIRFICFSNLIPVSSNKFWMHDVFSNTIKYCADFIITNEINTNKVINLIDSNL